MKARIVCNDGIIIGHRIPKGAQEFRYNKKRYIVDPRAVIRQKTLFIPFKTFMLYFENYPKPVTWPDHKGEQPKARMITGSELDKIFGTKALGDLGKQQHGPFPWKMLIIGVIVLAVLAGALQYLGVVGT